MSSLKRILLAAAISFSVTEALAGKSFSDAQRFYSLGDYGRALSIWLPMADSGDPRAQYSVAVVLSRDGANDRDLRRAERWAKAAAEQDYHPAKILLGQVRSRLIAAKPEKGERAAALDTPSSPDTIEAPDAGTDSAAPTDEVANDNSTMAESDAAQSDRIAETAPAAETATTATNEMNDATADVRTVPSPRQTTASVAAARHDQIKAELSSLLTGLTGNSSRGAISYGDIVVSGDGPTYQATIPNVVLATRRGVRFEIGDVAAEIQDDDPDFSNIFFTLPRQVTYADNKTQGAMAFERQDLAFRWNRDLQTSTQFHIRLFDVAFTEDGAAKPSSRFGEIGVVADVREGEERWSGPMAMHIRELRATSRNGGHLNVGSLALQLDFHDLDLPAYLAAATEARSAQASTGPLDFATDRSLGGIDLRFSVLDVAGDDPMSGPLALNEAHHTISFRDLDQAISNIGITLSHSGLSGQHGMFDAATTPRDMNVAVEFNNVPVEAVATAGVAAALEYMVLGRLSETSEIRKELFSALADAGFNIDIKRAEFSNERLDGSIDGMLEAKADADTWWAGDITVTIAGLPKSDGGAAGREISGTARASGGLDLLALIAPFGQPTADGQAHAFRFNVQPDGTIALNGKSIDSLLTATPDED